MLPTSAWTGSHMRFACVMLERQRGPCLPAKDTLCAISQHLSSHVDLGERVSVSKCERTRGLRLATLDMVHALRVSGRSRAMAESDASPQANSCP